MDRFVRPPDPESQQEPVLGWRLWRLRRNDAGELRIAPTTPRQDWEPGVALKATCTGSHTRLYMVFNPELEAAHRSPVPGCTCGVHALKDVARLLRSWARAAVVGRIAMWGRVLEHTRGYRAQFAYPSRLRLVCWWCRGPGGRAEPVGVGTDGRDLLPACEAHAGRLPPDAQGPTEVVQELLDTYRIEILPVEALARPA